VVIGFSTNGNEQQLVFIPHSAIRIFRNLWVVQITARR
jgi:hypothetical protein